MVGIKLSASSARRRSKYQTEEVPYNGQNSHMEFIHLHSIKHIIKQPTEVDSQGPPPGLSALAVPTEEPLSPMQGSVPGEVVLSHKRNGHRCPEVSQGTRD